MVEPPKRPWERGRNADYACFGLTVEICEDKDGNVWSQQTFQAALDEEIACTLASAGARQIAQALLLEALRREVFVDILVQMSKGEDYLVDYIEGGDEERRAVEQEIASAAATVIAKMLPKMLPAVAREMMEMVVSQFEPDEDPAGA